MTHFEGVWLICEGTLNFEKLDGYLLVMLWERHAKMGGYDFYNDCFYYFKRYGQWNYSAESLCVLQLFWQISLKMFLFFSQQIISISRKLWEYKYTKNFSQAEIL